MLTSPRRVAAILSPLACVLLLSTSAHAAPFTIHTTMLASNVVPPNASPAVGSADVTVDGDSLLMSLTWSGLTGGSATAGHLHCCAPPVSAGLLAITFPGFPLNLRVVHPHVRHDRSGHLRGELSQHSGRRHRGRCRSGAHCRNDRGSCVPGHARRRVSHRRDPRPAGTGTGTRHVDSRRPRAGGRRFWSIASTRVETVEGRSDREFLGPVGLAAGRPRP